MKDVPPAYQYYPRDFDAATRFFTLEEVGAYKRFLMLAADTLREQAKRVGGAA